MSVEAKLADMITRAEVTRIDDTPKMQTVQFVDVDPEAADDGVEHVQPYGFAAVPVVGAEGLALNVGGSARHAVVICVADRRYRLTALEAGEVAIHDDQGQKIHLTRAGIVIDGTFVKLGDGATLGVARNTDAVAVTIPIGAIDGTNPVAPVTVTGTITGGSATIKAVD